MATETSWILVGVDGSHGSDAAVDYAVAEAYRTGAGVRLVHVLPDVARTAGRYPMAVPMPRFESQRIGHRILRDAVQRTGDLRHRERVVAELLTGGRVQALVHAAQRAQLVVLGDERHSRLDRVLTGSVLTGVAARSTTSVVAVPNTWHPGDEHGRVVVAVKDCQASLGLVRRALDLATDRAATLVLLHAWELPTGYDDMIFTRVDAAEAAAGARAALQALVTQVTGDQPAERCPDVVIRVEHGQPAHVLIEASESADLLVVARRPHAFPLGHLGATGRAVVREAHCPVEVVPPAAEPAGLGLVLEADGAIDKGADDELTMAVGPRSIR